MQHVLIMFLEEEKQDEETSINRSGLLVRSGSMNSLASGLTDNPEEVTK